MLISKTKRHLKVYPKYRRNSCWQMTVIPEIRLCGKWLREIGFEHGQLITVRLECNKLIIEPQTNSGQDLPL